jgi:hypothetical protein
VGKEVSRQKTISHTQAAESAAGCVAQLAQFFPDIQPVQVRAELLSLKHGSSKLREKVLVEFASRENAIFSSTLPLEFSDRVRLQHAQENKFADAIVVAVQYQNEGKAVAVRFSDGQSSWVNRP